MWPVSVEPSAHGFLLSAATSWSENGEVVVGDGEGSVLFRSEDGRTWQAEALGDQRVLWRVASDATGARTLAASRRATGRELGSFDTLLQSIEGGPFTPAPADFGSGSVADIVWGDGVFVAVVEDRVDSSTSLWRSEDGETFVQVYSADDVPAEELDDYALGSGEDPLQLEDVVFAQGAFWSHGLRRILRSDDGITWESFSLADELLYTLRWFGQLDGEVVGFGSYDCCYGESPSGTIQKIVRFVDGPDGRGLDSRALPDSALRVRDAVDVGGRTFVADGNVVRLEPPVSDLGGTIVVAQPLAPPFSPPGGYSLLATHGQRIVALGDNDLTLIDDDGETSEPIELPDVEDLVPAVP